MRDVYEIFRDERGFTTTSMVLSLLITLALVFTAAQVYRVNSASAEVQDVADAVALAAENQVAEFMIVARFCDAVVLSLSLAGTTTLGLGIVALCTPAAEMSGKLIDAGKQLLEARDRFSERATQGLNKLQEVLPYFAAASAAGVAVANNADSEGAVYLGVGLLVPAKGEAISTGSTEEADKLAEDIDDKADEIREKARQADEAAKQANEAKMRAYMHDCGLYPGHCMRERAEELAGLGGGSNPEFSSVDIWSFSAALERARNYYEARRVKEGSDREQASSGGTPLPPAEEAQSHVRERYYRYARDLLLSEGFVFENGESFSANFPLPPTNDAETKATVLYTEDIYPVTEEPLPGAGEHAEGAPGENAPGEGGGSEGDPGEGGPAEPDTMPVMHAWSGCPGITGDVVMYSSISYMDSASLPTCPICRFTVASMSNVAYFTAQHDTGFEHHYIEVAREAETYEEERKRVDEQKAEVEEETSGLFDQFVKSLKEAADKRIDVSPPGAYGSLAFVVNTGSTSAAGGFASGFVASGGSLGPRAAVSAATIIDEGSDEGHTVLNSLIDGLREDGGAAVGAIGIMFDIWSAALSAYTNGYDAVIGGVESGLDSLVPFGGSSGLGAWAADKLRGAIEAFGFQPAKLEALKPVLVNSAHVAAKDDGSLGKNLIAVKQRIIAHPMNSTDLFTGVLTDAEKVAVERVEAMDGKIEIVSVELLGEGGPSIPITIPLPREAEQFGIGMIHDFFDRLRAQHAETVEVRAWE